MHFLFIQESISMSERTLIGENKEVLLTGESLHHLRSYQMQERMPLTLLSILLVGSWADVS